jgi:hypothetical protein
VEKRCQDNTKHSSLIVKRFHSTKAPRFIFTARQSRFSFLLMTKNHLTIVVASNFHKGCKQGEENMFRREDKRGGEEGEEAKVIKELSLEHKDKLCNSPQRWQRTRATTLRHLTTRSEAEGSQLALLSFLHFSLKIMSGMLVSDV